MLNRLMFLTALMFGVLFSAHAGGVNQLKGVNLSGAEYGGGLREKARANINYIWHNERDMERLARAGFSVVRVPFLWERFQPAPMVPIVNKEAVYLDKIVMAAEKYGLKVLIDPHNFGDYYGKLIGTRHATTESFKDFWAQLASRYKRFPNVIFGLMNEPHKHNSVVWAKIAQEAIYAIRETGAKQLILVPGTRWSGAHSWVNGNQQNPSNAAALASIKDPINNYAFEMHFYLDSDSSGTHKECVSETIGVERLKAATKWLNDNDFKGFLGEFGIADNAVCLSALDKTLEYLSNNKNSWLGWTYWSASKWGGNYMYDIYSLNPTKQKQFGIVKKHLH